MLNERHNIVNRYSIWAYFLFVYCGLLFCEFETVKKRHTGPAKLKHGQNNEFSNKKQACLIKMGQA